jgi:hypothetical protein
MNTEWLELAQQYTMHLELYYSKTMDWFLHIYKKGSGEKGKDLEICNEQSCDLSYVLAKGEVAIKEWLTENNGGY